MKYLLHSRKFRSNLFKWIFCYVGTMLLFTAVVTYSRYITTQAANDQARVARFDVTVSKICYDKDSQDPDSCTNSGAFRAKRNNSFYFTVDTTKMEVTSIFVTRITLSEKLTVDPSSVFIYNGSAGAADSWVSLEKLKLLKALNTNLDFEIEGNVITITEDVIASKGEKRKYRVDAQYKNFDQDERLTGVDIEDAITVGFSASQKK